MMFPPEISLKIPLMGASLTKLKPEKLKHNKESALPALYFILLLWHFSDRHFVRHYPPILLHLIFEISSSKNSYFDHFRTNVNQTTYTAVMPEGEKHWGCQ